MNRLIVIEGLDGSGKETQTKLLIEALEKIGLSCRRVSFPDYDSDSSALVKMYLSGQLGSSPDDVNPYAASSFYAADRFVSYNNSWKSDYESGCVIIADRYSTSNLIYQLSKVDECDREDFAKWVLDFEYNKLGLPSPDIVVYLDMDPLVSQKLIQSRYHGDESKKDIHEKNVAFLSSCRKGAMFSAELFGWSVINCCEGDSPRPIDDIHNDIISAVKTTLNLQ